MKTNLTPFKKQRVGLWDARPRFLGMFQVFDVAMAPGTYPPIPAVGMLDHLVTCECGTKGVPTHPKFHAACVYAKFGSVIFSVSWPTWFPL